VRCGGIFHDHLIANFLLSVKWKNFECKSVFGKDREKGMTAWFLSTRDVNYSVVSDGSINA